MEHIKTCAILLIILFLLPIIGGCWNYADVDTQVIVMGATIDMDKETGEFIFNLEVSKAKGGKDTEIIKRVESARGATLFEASRNSIMKIGVKLYWGHAMVYIISESVAKNGIADVMSLLSRQTQIRSDIYILIAENDSIDQIFEFADPIHNNVSQHLHDLLEAYEATGKYRRTPLFKILQELASPEMSLMLPIIKMVDKNEEENEKQEKGAKPQDEKDDDSKDSAEEETEGDKSAEDEETEETEEILIVEGCAIFEGDKMVGRLNEIQSRSALILKKEVNNNYVISIEESENIPKCAIEVINSDIKINPIAEDEETLLIEINLEIEGDIVELHSLVDYITDDKKGELENAFEKLIEQQLFDVIKKAQIYDSDVFGFAGITHIKQPSLWKSISDIWFEVYKDAKFDITVEVNITNSSLSVNPVKVGR